MKDRKYYVYEWFIKGNNEIFYVGKGCGNRATSNKDRNLYFKHIKAKYDCDYRIVKDNLTEQEALDFELKYGTELKNKGQCKASFAFGGKEKYISQETRQKISKSLKANNQKAWNSGIKNPYSDETLKKMSIAKVGTKQNEETKKRRSKALKGHKVSQETRHKMSISSMGEKNPMYHKKQSQETINKRVNKLLGHTVSEETKKLIGIANGKKVIQKDLNDNVIAIYESASKAAQKTNSNNSKISRVCRGERKTHNGYKWEYIAS